MTAESQDKSNNVEFNVFDAETFVSIPRRTFLSKGLLAAGSLILGSTFGTKAFAKTVSKKAIDTASLVSEFKFKGAVLTPKDPDFVKVALGGLWNELRPKRTPDLVLQVTDEQDVVAAVKFAKAKKLKVCVRGGGHNWCAPSVRNSGVMIDLTKLNKVISIDPEKKIAVMQPIISNREVQAALAPHNLAYPSGHCPTVKISGYLLSGGMAWNQGVWGPGVGSIEAIEMVTADGEMITASAKENPDYFWAARGAGPGMFAVCVRYHLRLYPRPKAITGSAYFYRYEDIVEVAKWLGPLASKISNTVELSLFAVTATKEFEKEAQSANGKIAMVTGTCFAETKEEAEKALAILDTCPIKCISKATNEPMTFEELFDASGNLWPDKLRCKVDAIFSNAPLEEVFAVVKDHFKDAPSKKTVYMFAIFTGPNVPAPLMDTAFSMSSKLYGGPWTMWEDGKDDEANIKWHADCMKKLQPLIAGHYVSETDTVGHPEYLKLAYKAENYKRLGELRKKYDPKGLFFNPTEALSENA